MNEIPGEKTRGVEGVAPLQEEKMVKRLPPEMNGATIETIVTMVARNTGQTVTWRVVEGEPTVFTTGDVYAVLRELRCKLPREYRRA